MCPAGGVQAEPGEERIDKGIIVKDPDATKALSTFAIGVTVELSMINPTA